MSITIGVYLPADYPPAHVLEFKDAKGLDRAMSKVVKAKCPHICIDPRPAGAGVVQGWDYSDPKVEGAAVVFAVRGGTVYYVADEGAGYAALSAAPVDFARHYATRLPGYPLRRYARACMAAPAPKAPQAVRVLRHLLTS